MSGKGHGAVHYVMQ